MQYGYFDDEEKEYVITDPETLKSWSNYLGSTEYGAIITNNAGRYSFYKSGGMGRFTRLRFNFIPMDQPGRYIYLRDEEDGDFYHKVLPYADRGEDSVYKHLKRAIQFSLDRTGKNGFPNGLSADWNNSLKFGKDGESVFVAFQLRFALREYIEISGLLNETYAQNWAKNELEKLDDNLQKNGLDGDWFRRGFGTNGMLFGSKQVDQGQIYLNPQTWAVISGAASKEQAESAMKNAFEKLSTKYGIKLCYPPYTNTDFNIVRAQMFNPELKR